MREIKIRAWNKNKKEFENSYFIKCNGNQGNMTYIKLDLERFKYKEIKEEVLFLLNTGLKDKNGVQGFHKDVVKDFRGGYYIIEWDEQYATFIMKERDNSNYLPIYFLRYGEIIGNILQDPFIL